MFFVYLLLLSDRKITLKKLITLVLPFFGVLVFSMCNFYVICGFFTLKVCMKIFLYMLIITRVSEVC